MSAEADPLRAELVLAEDDPDDRFLIERALRRARPRVSVTAVSDGIELMDLLQRRRDGVLPGLVLLDLNMPRMDGREVLASMSADAVLRAVPVVVLSTSVEPEDIARARALNAAAFVSKPDEFGKLMLVLREMLDTYLGPCPEENI